MLSHPFDMAFYDDYLCLVALNKQQIYIEEVKCLLKSLESMLNF